LGVLVSLSSVGAGAIGVTVLLILYPRLPVARIVGSDIDVIAGADRLCEYSGLGSLSRSPFAHIFALISTLVEARLRRRESHFMHILP